MDICDALKTFEMLCNSFNPVLNSYLYLDNTTLELACNTKQYVFIPTSLISLERLDASTTKS